MEHSKLHEMFKLNWHLGFTSFGGPAAHFQIVRFVVDRYCGDSNAECHKFHGLFVEKNQWIDEQMVCKNFLVETTLTAGTVSRAFCAVSSVTWSWKY